jgi:hypothetical protein
MRAETGLVTGAVASRMQFDGPTADAGVVRHLEGQLEAEDVAVEGGCVLDLLHGQDGKRA